MNEERYQRKKARTAKLQVLATCVSVNEESKVEKVESSVDDVEVQTEKMAGEIANLRRELNSAYETIRALQSNIECLQQFTELSLLNQCNQSILHYIGLPNLKTIYDFVVPKCNVENTKLTPFQELIVVLLKLRLNISSQDLDYRFDIHASTVSRILLRCTDTCLQPLIVWSERENIRKTMPECFRSEFGDKVAVVIDCFEVFIERPSNLLAGLVKLRTS